MKTTSKTKAKKISLANMDEKQKEIYDFLYDSYAARAKARSIIEEYLENPNPASGGRPVVEHDETDVD